MIVTYYLPNLPTIFNCSKVLPSRIMCDMLYKRFAGEKITHSSTVFEQGFKCKVMM